MVVDDNGSFVTGRAFPRMTTISVEIGDRDIKLDATGMTPLILKIKPEVQGSVTSCVYVYCKFQIENNSGVIA